MKAERDSRQAWRCTYTGRGIYCICQVRQANREASGLSCGRQAAASALASSWALEHGCTIGFSTRVRRDGWGRARSLGALSFAARSFRRDNCRIGQAERRNASAGLSARVRQLGLRLSRRTGGIEAWLSATPAPVASLRRLCLGPPRSQRGIHGDSNRTRERTVICGRRSMCVKGPVDADVTSLP